MKTTLSELERKYPNSEFTKQAQAGNWASAADSAAKHGMWGIWEQCQTEAGLPCGADARAAATSALLAAKKSKFSTR